jgi:hypothetical protein
MSQISPETLTRTLALIVAFVLACAGPALAADFKSAAADADAAPEEMPQARDFSGTVIVEVGDRRLLATRWRRVLRGAGKIKPQTIRAATAPRHPSEPRIYASYGLNVMFDDDGETIHVSHSGSDGVFFSYFWMSPRDDSFFYLVGNAGEEVTRVAVREVRRILYEAGGGGPHF